MNGFSGLGAGILMAGEGIAQGMTQKWMREEQLKQQEWENKLQREQFKLQQDSYEFQKQQYSDQMQAAQAQAQIEAQKRAQEEYANRVKATQWLVETRGWAQAPQAVEGVSPYPGYESSYQQDIYNVGIQDNQGTASRKYVEKPTKPVPETPKNVQQFVEMYMPATGIPEGENPSDRWKNLAGYFKNNLGRDVMHTKDYADTINHLNKMTKIERYNEGIEKVNKQGLGQQEDVTRAAPLSTQQVQKETLQIPNIITQAQEAGDVTQFKQPTFKEIQDVINSSEYLSQEDADLINRFYTTQEVGGEGEGRAFEMVNKVIDNRRQRESDLANKANLKDPKAKAAYIEAGEMWDEAVANATSMVPNYQMLIDKLTEPAASEVESTLTEQQMLLATFRAWQEAQTTQDPKEKTRLMRLSAMGVDTYLTPVLQRLAYGNENNNQLVSNPYYKLGMTSNQPEYWNLWSVLPSNRLTEPFLDFLESLVPDPQYPEETEVVESEPKKRKRNR